MRDERRRGERRTGMSCRGGGEEMRKRGKTNMGEKTRRREDESRVDIRRGRGPKHHEGRKRLKRTIMPKRETCWSSV